MNVRDAVQLIAPAVLGGGRWADLGAGRGTFTAALARLLGPGGTVYAIERDATAIAALEMLARRGSSDGRSAIVVRHVDFTQPMELPSLDGVLLANALHFVPDNEQARVLEHVARGVVRGGAIVVVEYDNRPPSRWVPYPVSLTRLADLASETSVTAPEVVGRRLSDFGGTMYAARMSQR